MNFLSKIVNFASKTVSADATSIASAAIDAVKQAQMLASYGLSSKLNLSETLPEDPRKTKYSHLPDTPLVLSQNAAASSMGAQYQQSENGVYHPAEKLTGISQDRPEIIMLTDFKALYDFTDSVVPNDAFDTSRGSYSLSGLTPTGLLFDARTNEVRISRNKTTQLALSALKRGAPPVQDYSTLWNISMFLRNVVQHTQKTRELLDLRDTRHVVGTDNVMNKMVSMSSLKKGKTQTQDFIENKLQNQYSLIDFLVAQGYKNASEFSSTKLWCQSTIEYKSILTAHGDAIKSSFVENIKNDVNPYAINTIPRNVITFKQSATIPSINSIKKFSFDRIDDGTAVKAISTGFQNLFTQNLSDVTNQLASTIWCITQEYRYSNGIAKPTVANELSERFSYNISTTTTNSNLFDNVLGTSPQVSYQIPRTIDNSVANIAYTRVLNDDIAILNFETSYLTVGDNSTITPGAEYYIDSVLDTFSQQSSGSNVSLSFNDLKQFGKRLNDTSKALHIVADGMNWLAEPRADVTISSYSDLQQNGYLLTEQFYSSPTEQLNEFITAFLNTDKSSIYSSYSTSWVTALIKLASSAANVKLKSMLFLFAMSQVVRDRKDTSDFTKEVVTSADTDVSDYITANITNTGEIQDRLLDNIVNEIKTLLTDNGYVRDNSPKISQHKLTFSALKQALVSSTPELWKKITSMLSSYIGSITHNNEVVLNSRTRYRGIIDTGMVMGYFDAMLMFIAQYSVQQFDLITQASQTYVTTYKPSTSIQSDYALNVMTILDDERKSLHEGYISIIGTLDAVSKIINEHVAFFENSSTADSLGKIRNSFSKTIDPHFLRMMFYEQQSMLLSSIATDMASVIASNKTTEKNSIKIYDLALTSLDFKEYCLAAFSNPEFTLNRGNAKILSVGIPIGFAEKLKQTRNVNIAGNVTGTARRQNDIITINVQKIDIRFADVVFKPKKFMFELSRFPVRNISYYPKLPQHPSITDVIVRVPMRDITQGVIGTSDAIQYGAPDVASVQSADLQSSTVPSISTAFETVDYDFLTNDQKYEMKYNHAISFLLELYVKVLTDISVSENSMHIDPQYALTTMKSEIANDIITNVISYIDSTSSVRNNASNTPVALNNDYKTLSTTIEQQAVRPVLKSTNTQSTSTQKSLSTIATTAPQRPLLAPTTIADVARIAAHNTATLKSSDAKLIANVIQDMNSFFSVHSNLSDMDSVTRTMFAPRQYDRVFHLLVDPDEFEIDYNETTNSTYGKEMLEQMIAEGLVLVAAESDLVQTQTLKSNVQTQSLKKYVYKPTNKDAGDFNLDKYFVSIELPETFGLEKKTTTTSLSSLKKKTL